ncbi:hypothetical protein ACFWIY_00070 [Streptomyces sioyaensis]|uniref:hypothetical protein n=1 Tax=Streptomyces sioyaensis TaxID=67364 RepID=UPI003666A830
MTTPHWHFVQKRTADPAGGAVYVNDDRTCYRRTGVEGLVAEAAYQRQLAGLGYPVPRVLEDGTTDDGNVYIVEESPGERSLHDMALKSLDGTRALSDTVVDLAADVGGRLARMQEARSALYLLCASDTVDLADALARRVWSIRPTDGGDDRRAEHREMLDLLCRFTLRGRVMSRPRRRRAASQTP